MFVPNRTGLGLGSYERGPFSAGRFWVVSTRLSYSQSSRSLDVFPSLDLPLTLYHRTCTAVWTQTPMNQLCLQNTSTCEAIQRGQGGRCGRGEHRHCPALSPLVWQREFTAYFHTICRALAMPLKGEDFEMCSLTL